MLFATKPPWSHCGRRAPRPFFTEQLDKALCRSLLATRYSSREPSKHPSGEHPPIIQHRWRQRLSQQSTVDAVPNGGTGETFWVFQAPHLFVSRNSSKKRTARPECRFPGSLQLKECTMPNASWGVEQSQSCRSCTRALVDLKE